MDDARFLKKTKSRLYKMSSTWEAASQLCPLSATKAPWEKNVEFRNCVGDELLSWENLLEMYVKKQLLDFATKKIKTVWWIPKVTVKDLINFIRRQNTPLGRDLFLPGAHIEGLISYSREELELLNYPNNDEENLKSRPLNKFQYAWLTRLYGELLEIHFAYYKVLAEHRIFMERDTPWGNINQILTILLDLPRDFGDYEE